MQNRSVGPRLYLGMSYLAWALCAWAGVFGTFLTILIYRYMISYRDDEEAYMNAEEIRLTHAHIRHVNRMALWFGAASGITFAGIVAGWVAGLL